MICSSHISKTDFYHRLPGRPTEEVYEAIVTEAGLLKDIEPIDTLNLCWIGSRTAKTVLVYFCGTDTQIHIKIVFPTHCYSRRWLRHLCMANTGSDECQ